MPPRHSCRLKTQLAKEMGARTTYHGHSGGDQYFDDYQFRYSSVPGDGVIAVLGQPAERVFVWVVLIALLFAGINGLTMFMIGKGSMRCALHLTLCNKPLTVIYLLAALSGRFSGRHRRSREHCDVTDHSSILSTSFYKMLLFTLHNSWRKRPDAKDGSRSRHRRAYPQNGSACAPINFTPTASCP
jgi:hypothetical protein